MARLKKREITEEMREQIVNMTRESMPPAAIAKELEISSPSVYRILQESGIRPARAPVGTGGRTAMTDEDIDEFVTLYYNFVPIAELLKQFQLTHTQMYKILSDLDLEPRMRQKENKEARDAAMEHALELYQNAPDMKVSEILDETGIQQPALSAEITRRNIPQRRPRKSKAEPQPGTKRYDQ